MIFKDRVEAGEILADKLEGRFKEKGLVLGIPRGGVVLAKVVAERLGWELEVLVTKKIGFPSQPELAMGAVAETGEPVWDEGLKGRIDQGQWQVALKEAKEKVGRYVKEFRGGKQVEVKGKVAMIVDDGVATGRTVEAGIKWLRGEGVGRVVIAMPVCAKGTAKKLKKLVDEWVCLDEPRMFYAVGQFYRNFPQVEDEEVKRLLSD